MEKRYYTYYKNNKWEGDWLNIDDITKHYLDWDLIEVVIDNNQDLILRQWHDCSAIVRDTNNEENKMEDWDLYLVLEGHFLRKVEDIDEVLFNN